MTTIIEDNQLNTELQELYLVSKQWLSELAFLETEYEFLKKRAADLLATEAHPAEFEQIAAIGIRYHDLKQTIETYLHQLEPLITTASSALHLTLIEQYAGIEKELAGFTEELHTTKSTVLELTKAEHLKIRQIPATPGAPTLKK
ncbi:MAG: hypothetical protein ABIN91_03975 [Mucilaginibacter sp.]|uniref:hypothetical protein n=1 Tax=Mucilaginibacter sp. TaxID=1882438 RepID=UPI0032647DE8